MIDEMMKRLANLTPAELRTLADAAETEAALIEKQQRRGTFPKEIAFYVHSNKDDNSYKGEKLGLEGAALDTFRYSGLEIEITCMVHEDGTSHAIALNQVPLKQPVKL